MKAPDFYIEVFCNFKTELLIREAFAVDVCIGIGFERIFGRTTGV